MDDIILNVIIIICLNVIYSYVPKNTDEQTIILNTCVQLKKKPTQLKTTIQLK